MPVVINEFEVVVAPPQQDRGAGAGSAAQQDPAPPLAPHDIEAILRHERDRYSRIRAH